MRIGILVNIFLLCLCAGCRPLSRPHLELPEKYFEEKSASPQPSSECDLVAWWEQFQDPLLNQLLFQAINCNYDLRIAREKICEARAFLGVAFSKILPQVDGILGSSRLRNSETLNESEFLGGTFINYFQTGFDSIWELDLFGKNTDAALATAYEVVATAEQVRDIHVTITSEIAHLYFMIRALQERIEITQNHIKTESELHRLVKARYEAGLIPKVDVYIAQSLLEGRKAILPNLQRQLQQTIYAVAVLLGKNPEALTETFLEKKPLPETKEDFPLGFPSDLLCRRGDIRHAEYAMHAAGARAIVSRKELFPTISLSGFYTYASGFVYKWFRPASRFWEAAPSIVLPIFHGGGILANIRAHTSKQKQKVLEYEKAVLNALKDVESALIAYFKEKATIAALEEKVSADRAAHKLAETLYFSGVVDFLYVLTIERDLYVSENRLVESREDLLTHFIAIYKSLGGGWECYG